jgi:hypothetical protein
MYVECTVEANQNYSEIAQKISAVGSNMICESSLQAIWIILNLPEVYRDDSKDTGQIQMLNFAWLLPQRQYHDKPCMTGTAGSPEWLKTMC